MVIKRPRQRHPALASPFVSPTCFTTGARCRSAGTRGSGSSEIWPDGSTHARGHANTRCLPVTDCILQVLSCVSRLAGLADGLATSTALRPDHRPIRPNKSGSPPTAWSRGGSAMSGADYIRRLGAWRHDVDDGALEDQAHPVCQPDWDSGPDRTRVGLSAMPGRLRPNGDERLDERTDAFLLHGCVRKHRAQFAAPHQTYLAHQCLSLLLV